MIATDINTIASFLGRRDLCQLDKEELKKKFSLNQVDVFVLFGGSILEGAKVFADAKRSCIAKNYLIVGGEGHTTPFLRKIVNERYPDLITDNLPEAVIFKEYLIRKYNIEPNYIETKSTNCGNNITNMLDLLDKNHIECNSIILCQDESMQLRMWTGLKKYRPDCVAINYASYQATVIENNESLSFKEKIDGMWDMDRYISLIMSEIPRLNDNEKGYGPKGKDFICHVDIDDKTMNAYKNLSTNYGSFVRNANSKYASK